MASPPGLFSAWPQAWLARQHADPRQEITGPGSDLRDRHRRGACGRQSSHQAVHIHSLQGFFTLSTWLTAIAGVAVLLLASHLVTGKSGRPRRPAGSRTAEPHRARLRRSADPGATVPDVITALAGDATTAGAVRPSRSPGAHQCAAILPPCPTSDQRRGSF
jgi:hypothetical protein